MFLGNVIGYTSVAEEAIPLVTVINSNDKITNNNGVLSINKSGYYDIDATLSLLSTTATTVNVHLYADGQVRPIATKSVTVGANAVANVSIVDAIKVVLAQVPSVATIYLAVSVADLTVNATARVEYVR